jgi:hypothetical protein
VSKQDSHKAKGLAYGKHPSLIRSAVRTLEVGIKAEFRRKKKKMPQGKELRRMAIACLRSSIKNGPDNHIGTAEQRY